MTLFALIAALLIEQARPLASGNRVHAGFRRYVTWLERQLNAAQHRHGAIAWCAAVLPGVIVAACVYAYLHSMSVLLAWAWNVGLLYLTLGFRQFSHAYTSIVEALHASDFDRARAALSGWRGRSAQEFDASELARAAIERGLVDSHRHVFGVMFWAVLSGLLGLGTAGALAYRQAALLGEEWGARTDEDFGEFGAFSAHAFAWMDWLPARLTAASFAVVGDFEDAVYCWRAQAAKWPQREQGIILASGAGAIGVRLGEALHEVGGVELRPALGTGDEADVESMRSTVGLIWRAVLLWLALILLMTLANWFGH